MSSGAGLGEMPWQREASERPWGEAQGKIRGSPATCQALALLPQLFSQLPGVGSPAQGHTDGKQRSQDSNQAFLTPKPVTFLLHYPGTGAPDCRLPDSQGTASSEG